MALDTLDNIVREAGQGSGNAKGVEFVMAFGEIEDEDAFELQTRTLAPAAVRQYLGEGTRQTPNVAF